MWRLRPATLRGALWAAIAVLRVRRDLRRHGLKVQPPTAPLLSDHAMRGVGGVLHRLSPTCLERAIVAQACMSRRGDRRDVVIGVPLRGLTETPAHAWLDGSVPSGPEVYREIHRLPAPDRG